MKARYGRPDGRKYDANEIHRESPKKPGPWYCATEGCPVQFKGHRVAAYAVNEPGRLIRSGTFPHGDDRAHLPTCNLNARASKQRLLAAHRDVLSEEGDKLLLHWGDAPRLDRPSGTPEPRGHAGMTRERYAAVMSAASDIAKLVDDSDNDEEVLKRYWVVHNGIKIEWSRFCYGPGGDDLHRIVESIESVFNSSSAPWPRLVRAIVADPADTTDNRVRLSLRAPTKRCNGEYVRLNLFAKPGTVEAALLRAFVGSEQIFVLGDGADWRVHADTGKTSIWISKPEQISTGAVDVAVLPRNAVKP